MEKKTLGQIATELQKKAVDNTHTAHDQMQECLTDWDRALFDCINTHKSLYPPEDFYVVIITKKERLLENVLRNYFFVRITCPTPDYDQTVYLYRTKEEIVDFIWTIPSKDTCLMMTQAALAVPEEEKQLLQFVLDFADGTLYKKCKKLNGEEEKSNILEE